MPVKNHCKQITEHCILNFFNIGIFLRTSAALTPSPLFESYFKVYLCTYMNSNFCVAPRRATPHRTTTLESILYVCHTASRDTVDTKSTVHVNMQCRTAKILT
jgi:hypothetical protein